MNVLFRDFESLLTKELDSFLRREERDFVYLDIYFVLISFK